MDHKKPDCISFSGTISMNEFLKIQRACTPIWARWYVFIPCMLNLFVFLDAGWSRVASHPTSLLPDLILTALIFVAVAAITRHKGVRAWREMILLFGGIHGLVTDWGIEWTTKNTNSKFEWSKFIKTKQKTDFTLVFYTKRGLFYFPRSFFASESEWHKFNALVRSRVNK